MKANEGRVQHLRIAGLIAVKAANGELETVNRQGFEYFGRSLE